MRRRDVLLVGAGVTLAKVTTTTIACAGDGGRKSTPPSKPVTAPAPADDRTAAAKTLADALGHCRVVGEACMAHCLREFAAGDTMMAKCAQRTTEMLAVCEAMQRLVAAASDHAAALARVCKAVCSDCAAACAPHVGHHESCKQCHDSCVACVAAVDAAYA